MKEVSNLCKTWGRGVSEVGGVGIVACLSPVLVFFFLQKGKQNALNELQNTTELLLTKILESRECVFLTFLNSDEQIFQTFSVLKVQAGFSGV